LLCYKGLVIGRLECTFYAEHLKNPDLYKEIIDDIFDGDNEESIITEYPCFRKVNVRDYFRELFHGEEKYGRVIYLEEVD